MLICDAHGTWPHSKMSFGVYRPQMGVASGMRVLCSDQTLQDCSGVQGLGFRVLSGRRRSAYHCPRVKEQRRAAEQNGRQQATQDAAVARV